MIIYASATFVKRLKCTVPLSEYKPVQVQSLDGWSGDLLKVPRAGEVAVMMHNGSLATLIVPLKGMRKFQDFLPLFLQKVSELFNALGATIDPANQNTLVLSRNNRSLIGSLNDAKYLIGCTVGDQLDEGEPVDWNKAAEFINRTPFSLIDYETPIKALTALVSKRPSSPAS